MIVIGFIEMGRLTFRTRLMEIEKAARFAKCLQANARFTGVEIQTSRRATSEIRYFVTFLPSNPERIQAMLESQQATRAERAESQVFTFCADLDHPFYFCHSAASGEVYETTARSCSCPDAHYRLNGTGLLCKHSIALRHVIARNEVEEFQRVPPRPAENQRTQDRFCEIFG
jgi:SWIM zinc finger